MIKLIRWLFGYVEFAFTKGFFEGFINDCFEQKINIHDIKRNEDCISAVCLAREYKRLRSVAKKNGGTVKIIKRHGIAFPLSRLAGRSGIIAGFLAFIIIFNALSGCVWSIEITGNKSIKTAQLGDFLQENGLYEGRRWDDISTSTIENLVLAKYDECAFVHINRFGSKAVVEIDEGVLNPKPDNAKGRANLKATKDGIITYTNIKRGWDIVKIGSAVTKGDLLASGVYESELNKTNLFTHASGVVIARVEEPIDLTIARKQAEKLFTTEELKKSLIFFGIKIPLYIGKTKTQSCETEEEIELLKLNKCDLPIGISTKHYRYYVKNERELSDKELTKLTKQEIEKELKSEFADCEIIDKSIEIQLSSNCATAKGTVTVLENIAEEVYF